MTVVSPAFLVLAFLTVAAVQLLRGRVGREPILLAASLVFVAITLDPVSLAGLAAFAAAGFALLRAVGRRRRAGVLAAAVTTAVALFWLLGENDLDLHALQHPEPIVLLGLSYVMFRVVHLLVDVGEGELPAPPGLVGYLGYLLFFPNFLAGPIQRYEHFAPQVAAPAPPLDAATARAGLSRMLSGGFAVVVLSGLSYSTFELCRAAVADGGLAGGAALGAACLAYALHLYAAFAGYMGVVIGLGRLLGLEIPENFDRPWAARNFLDLWSRWHVTLSDWFKFYLFNPVTKELLRVVARPAWTPWLGAVGFFLTFFVMGVWHGTDGTFAVYGLMLGLGVSVNKVWQVAMSRRLGRRRYAALSDASWYRVAARTLALACFALALVLIWSDLRVAAALPGVVGLAGAVVAVGVVVGTIAVAATLAEVWPASWTGFRPNAALTAIAQAVAVVLYLAVWHGPVPELIYQRF